jgi:hypothetical protein
MSNEMNEVKAPPACEKEANNRGRGGEFAPRGTPINLALIQDSAANVYHAYKSKERGRG